MALQGVHKMNQMHETLTKRLEEKGITSKAINGLIRDLETSIVTYPDITLNELNTRLNQLGWIDVELDHYTLQLIIALLEFGQLISRYHNGNNPIASYSYANS